MTTPTPPGPYFETRRADIFAWVKKLPEIDWPSTWGSELSAECTDAIAAARECPTLTYFEGRCDLDEDFMRLLTAARHGIDNARVERLTRRSLRLNTV